MEVEAAAVVEEVAVVAVGLCLHLEMEELWLLGWYLQK